jgi:oxygen-independent coproporphyrinogen-3 oxidase
MIEGLYLHIPFCARRCAYCDFNTYEGLEALIPSYVAALSADLARSALGDDGAALKSVFFGGGTPSLLPPELVAELLLRVRQAFPRAQALEASLEANPGAVEASSFKALRRAGINRLSLGVQASQDRALKALGRIHDSAQAERAVRLAQEAGFERLSVDLMFGLPGQSMQEWQQSLDWALGLGLSHISFYGLSVEPGTRFHALQAQGRLELPEEGLQADMYLAGVARLAAAGLVRYEISNFAKPGQACQHNRLYWLNRDTLGLGAGAWSFLKGERFGRTRDPKAYVQELAKGPASRQECQRLKGLASRGEAAYLRLRLAEGVDLAGWEQEFQRSWDSDFNGQTSALLAKGLLQRQEARLFIPDQALPLANEVFREFVISSEM